MKYIYILFIALLLIGCNNSETKKELAHSDAETELHDDITITKQQFTNNKMILGTLEEQDFNTTIKATGSIDVPPSNKAVISTFMGGYITKSPLLVGDRVEKGQVLASLENTAFVELQQEYLEVAGQLSYLKAEFERQKTLYNENISSRKNYLKAEGTYKSNLAHYNGLRKKLEMLNISPSQVEKGNITSVINLFSPIDGTISKVNVSHGAYVSPSDEILEIVDTHHIHLELEVFEKDILNIKKEQSILFSIPEASDKVFEAEVHLVGTTINETTRTIKVHGHIHDEDEANFIVGMFVDANIVIDSTKNKALPNESIIDNDDASYVLVLTNESESNYQFKKVKVELGEQNNQYTSILNPEVLNNKKVLTRGGYMLINEGKGGHSH